MWFLENELKLLFGDALTSSLAPPASQNVYLFSDVAKLGTGIYGSQTDFEDPVMFPLPSVQQFQL